MSTPNILKIDGHPAVISYDPEIDMFRGQFIALNGSADFYASNIVDLKREGADSLHTFLAVCKERGIAPGKRFSGTFNVRVGQKRHEALAITAAARGISMNALIDQAIEHELAH